MLAEEGAHHPADRGLRAAATCHVVRPRADGRDLERRRPTRTKGGGYFSRIGREVKPIGDGMRRLELESEDSIRRRVAARKKTRTRDALLGAQRHRSH